MRIVPLEIGRLHSSMRLFTGDDEPVTMPVIAWLVEHPDGLVLFDAGMHPELQSGPDRLGRDADYFRPDFPAGEELPARLADRGIRPGDVGHVVVSHLHFDHVGGSVGVPDARLVVQDDEWRAGRDPEILDRGVYNPSDYAHGHDVEAVDGDHDVFGDGRVRCLPTPGHTRGHQSLRVELDSGPVVLTADCVHLARMFDEDRVPRFGHDLDVHRRSLAEIRRLHDAEGCRLLYGHDLAQVRDLPADGLV